MQPPPPTHPLPIISEKMYNVIENRYNLFLLENILLLGLSDTSTTRNTWCCIVQWNREIFKGFLYSLYNCKLCIFQNLGASRSFVRSKRMQIRSFSDMSIHLMKDCCSLNITDVITKQIASVVFRLQQSFIRCIDIAENERIRTVGSCIRTLAWKHLWKRATWT